MHLIFGHLRRDRGHLHHLMPERLGICPFHALATTPTMRGLADHYFMHPL